MPNFTPNYNLTLPLPTEGYSIAIVNDNNQKIDTALNGLKVRADNQDAKVATTSSLGQVIVGNGLAINSSGVLSATAQTPPAASTTVAGIVQLNDAINSASTTQSATANAVKKVNDAKVDKAGDIMSGNLTIAKNVPIFLMTSEGAVKSTEIRFNASDVADFGLDIYRGVGANNVLAVQILENGITNVRDLDGTMFSLPSLKQSVVNGKASIADAISGKGIPTATDAEFATLVTNINAINTSKIAEGVAYGNQQLLDIPSGTFDFTPKSIMTHAVNGSYVYVTNYVPNNAFYVGSPGYGITTSHQPGNPTVGQVVLSIYDSTIIRNGGFRTLTSPISAFPPGGINVTWYAFG